MPRRLTFSSLFGQCAALMIALAGYHFLLRQLMVHRGLRLGAVSYQLAPLYAYWRPHLKGWLVLPLAVLVVYLWTLRRTRVGTSLTDAQAVAFFWLSSLAIAVSVAMLDGGPRSLIVPLVERPDLEYYGAIGRVSGVAEFLHDYPRLASTMPMHAQVHPPGAILFLWAVAKLFGAGPWAAAAGIIGFSSFSVILVYRWANRLGGPGVARRAAAICVLTPSLVLFTATSMDGPFAVALIATMYLFWESLEKRPILFGSLAGLAGGLAALMTYSVAVALLFCGLAACSSLLTDRARRRSTLVASAAALAGFVGLHLVLWLVTGYDPIEMFCVAVRNSNHIMAGTRHESLERCVHLTVGNLVVFFVAAGLPCTVIWWPTVVQCLRGRSTAGRSAMSLTEARGASAASPHDSTPASAQRFALAALLTLLIAAAVPVYTLEVERIWMFLVPLVVLPVSVRLFEQERGSGRVRGSLAVAVLLATQTLVTEMLLSTYW